VLNFSVLPGQAMLKNSFEATDAAWSEIQGPKGAYKLNKAVWQVVDHGGGGLAPTDGSSMAKFVVPEDSANWSLLYLPGVVDLPDDADSADVVFWMFHQGIQYFNNRIQVQVSIDGGLYWDDVGAPIPLYNGTEGWVRETVDLSDYKGAKNLLFGIKGIAEGVYNIYIDDLALRVFSTVQETPPVTPPVVTPPVTPPSIPVEPPATPVEPPVTPPVTPPVVTPPVTPPTTPVEPPATPVEPPATPEAPMFR